MNSQGGDIFINVYGTGTVMCTSREDSVPLSLSPPDANEQVTGTILEGKRSDAVSLDTLLYQLMANMVTVCTRRFEQLVIEMEDEATLHSLNIISCYGIACTGSGEFSFLKLKLNLEDEKMHFITKIPLSKFFPSTTAALIDFCIHYITAKAKQ